MTARAEYRAAAGRIRAGVTELSDLVARVQHIRNAEHHGDDWYIDALALNLHGFYAVVAGFSPRVPRGASLRAAARWYPD